MILKYTYSPRVLLVLLSAILGMASATSMAADYSPDEFLKLDLSKAALSPNPLGPANSFGPVPSKTPAESAARRQARATPAPHRHATRAPVHGAARTRLAHRRRNPLDAQAMDTRIQVWPCKSGGICSWKP